MSFEILYGLDVINILMFHACIHIYTRQKIILVSNIVSISFPTVNQVFYMLIKDGIHCSKNEFRTTRIYGRSMTTRIHILVLCTWQGLQGEER